MVELKQVYNPENGVHLMKELVDVSRVQGGFINLTTGENHRRMWDGDVKPLAGKARFYGYVVLTGPLWRRSSYHSIDTCLECHYLPTHDIILPLILFFI